MNRIKLYVKIQPKNLHNSIAISRINSHEKRNSILKKTKLTRICFNHNFAYELFEVSSVFSIVDFNQVDIISSLILSLT
jgi:hypothetical protein